MRHTVNATLDPDVTMLIPSSTITSVENTRIGLEEKGSVDERPFLGR
jgi:hypothetical protein